MNAVRSASNRPCTWLLLLLLFPLLVAPLPPLPALPAVGKPPAKVADAPKAGERKEDIQEMLDHAQRELALIEATPQWDAGAPEVVSEEELKQRRNLLLDTIRGCKRQLDALGRNAALEEDLAAARQRAEGPLDLVPPPHSLLLLDRLLREQAAARRKVEALQRRKESLEEVREYIDNQLLTLASVSRQADERAQAGGAAPEPLSVWGRELARIRLRAQTVQFLSINLAHKGTQFEIAIAQQEERLLERQVAAVRGHTQFPEDEFQGINQALDAELRSGVEALNRAMEAEEAAATALSKAKQDLDEAMLARKDEEGEEHLATLRQVLREAQRRVRDADLLVGGLRLVLHTIEVIRLAWTYRHRLARERSPELLNEIGARHHELALRLKGIDRLLEGLAQEVETDPDSAARASLLQGRTLVDQGREVLGRLAEEAGTTQSELSAGEHLSLVGDKVTDLAQSFWTFELFTVEQTVEVDGKQITGSSSVTVGKILYALSLFVLGILLVHWVGLAVERIVIRRFKYEGMRARILRKWLFALGVLILVVVVLDWVHIPLTVFAFLGGAIAIGVGVGMQNLLKNLISGLMLLFERPVQPGDFVEVGTIRGYVREIGIRSSIIRDQNHIDTIIPNSTFVDQNVTNWVRETPKVRSTIRVHVAYGASVKEVVRVLEEVAGRHHLVLDDPAPKVLLENFAPDALEFELLHWIEVGPNVTVRRVASDLRYMVEKAFREHGIAFPYPRHDVHLTCERPVPVQILADGEGGGDS